MHAKGSVVHNTFFSTVAVSALLLALPNLVHAQAVPQGASDPNACDPNGGMVVSCSGNLVGGVAVTEPVVTLNVNKLDAPGIAPAADVDGINFTPTVAQDIIINVDTTGTAGIETKGYRAAGISARQTNTNGDATDITITSTGDIITTGTEGSGIVARRTVNGDTTVTSKGNINAQSYGIDASYNGGDGTASVTSIGNITTDAIGIIAGSVFTSGSNISASVVSTGNITSTGPGNTSSAGIFAISGSFFGGGIGDVSVISTGNIETVGTGAEGIIGVALNDGDVSITSAGNISTMGMDAKGIDAAVRNNGNIAINSIGMLSAFDDGISAEIVGDGNVSITSTGNITSGAEEGIDAEVQGDGNIVISSQGDITTDDEAIDATIRGAMGGNITITKLGALTSNSSNGIDTIIENGNGNIFVQSTGPITAQEDGIFAIQDGGNGDININSNGNITANDQGIQADLDGSGSITINTSGSVTGTTGIQVDVRAMNAPTTITSSAAITGTGGTAINLAGDGNDVVNINAGSVITGSIDFGNGNGNVGLGGTNPNDIDTLNVGPGFNGVLNFADAGGDGQGDTDLESAPEIITGTVALVNNGPSDVFAVAVDASGFAAQGTVLSDVTNAVFNLVDIEDPSLDESTSTSTFGFGVSGSKKGSESDTRLWGAAFGGINQVGSTSTTTSFDHNFGGLATGIEMGDAQTDGTLGILGGYSNSNVSLDFGNGGTDTDSLFGGAYWKRDYGTHRVHAAFIGGVTDNESTRNISNGGGQATGDYYGYFYAPSVTLIAPIDVAPMPLFVSGRASYLGINLDGYTETGSASPLTVDDRMLSVVNLRGQLTLPQVIEQTDGSRTQIKWSAGVDATLDAGSDDVDAFVGATPLGFSADTVETTAGFLGISLTHTSADGSRSISFGGEAQSDFDGSLKATANVKFKLRF